MLKVFNSNPVAEAMLYYFGKANNETAKKRFSEISKRYPEHKEAFKEAAEPAIRLEKMLDSKLNANNTLVGKFFKKLGDRTPAPPFGFCIASFMIYYPMMSHFGCSPDELFKFLRECSIKERMYSFCFGLLDKCETLEESENGIDEFSKRIENLQLASENKWKLIDAAFNYQVRIEELLSLIIPAAKLIADVQNDYKSITEQFYTRYTDKNVQTLWTSFFDAKFEQFAVMRVAPMILGFANKFAVVEYNKNNNSSINNVNEPLSCECNLFLGTICYIVNDTLRDEVSEISNKMQALSDSTRLEMLFYLCSHRAYGQELCAKYGLVRSVLSYHMSKLLAAGFVTTMFDGGKTYYEADKAGIQRIIDAFAEKIK